MCLIMSSLQSCFFIPMRVPLKYSSTNVNGSLLMKRKNNNIFCCQNSESVRGYGGFSSNSTQPGERSQDVQPLESTVVDRRATTAAAVEPLVVESDRGIGVVKFLQGKCYFITGATGFVAKVLVEKLLRTVPNVGKIFILIKAKNKEAAMDRLKNELIDSELFGCLKQMHGKSYEAFMSSKLVPVFGNVCESNLGMDANSTHEIAKEIDVIINSAANTTFDERYDVSLNTNTNGPCRLLNFAKKCKKLCLFLHVSTAYVNGEREGVIKEKPFYMGDSIARERITSETPPTSYPMLDVDAEIKLAFQDIVADQTMKELGLERARTYGWRNVYEFTKAMGEMLINSSRGNIQVVIVRPTIVQSTYKEPFPGWIQGNRMLDPLILSYGKGNLPGFHVNPEAVGDLIPVDMLVNAMIAATAKHGIAEEKGINVYHVASSVVNPLMFHDFFKISYDYFCSSPLMDSKGQGKKISGMKFFSSLEDFSSYIGKEIRHQSGLMEVPISDHKISQRLERKCKAVEEHFIKLAKTYEPYMFQRGLFDNGNTHKLMEDMSEEEKRSFGFDVQTIEWKDFLSNVQIPGLRKHVMKGK